MPDVDLVGLCDVRRDIAMACAAEFGITAVFTDVDHMLREARPNVVHLLTPPNSHVPLVRCAAEHGAHIYVEKPFASSEAEAREIAEIAASHGVLVCPGHNRLFDPVMLAALRRVQAGEIGRVVGIRAEQGYSYDPNARGAAPPWSYTYAWGIFENLMPHPLYLVSHFLAEPEAPRVVAVDLGRIRESAVDEIRVLIPSREAIGEVTLSLTLAPESNRVEILGTKGRIVVDLLAMTLVVARSSGLPSIVTRFLAGLSTSRQLVAASIGNAAGMALGRIKRYPGVRKLVAEFYESIRSGRAEAPVSVRAGILNAQQMEVIQRACAAVAKPTIDEGTSGEIDAARVLVTGATGFVGRHVVRGLADSGVRVRAAARILSRGRLDANVVWIPFDLGRDDDLRRAVAGVATVYHCAALVGSPGSLRDFELINADATIRLLEAARDAGVSRFVYLSSVGVYGMDGGLELDESADYDPRADERGAYTQSKLSAEKAVIRWAQQHPNPRIVILRPGTVYGIGAPLPVGRLVLYVSDRRPLVAGSSRVTMALTHVENVVDAMTAAGAAQLPTGSIFNIVDSSEINQGAVAATLGDLTGGRLRPIFIPYPIAWCLMLTLDTVSLLRRRGLGTARYRLKRSLAPMRFPCTAARRDLNWSPRINHRDGLAQVLAADDGRSPFPH